MTRPIDPERLAALIDGRLDPKARADVLEELDASPEAIEVFADAATVQCEMESSGKRKAARWRRGPVFWAALAAALAFAVVTPLVWRGSRARPVDPLELAMRLKGRVGSGFVLREGPWDVTRGGGAGAVTPTGVAVRVGARLVDLAVLAQAGDSAAAASVALEIGALLRGAPVAGVGEMAFGNIATTRTAKGQLTQLPGAARAAEAAVDAEALRAGAWLEAAYLAAASGDEAFFGQPGAEAAIRELSSLTAQNGMASAAISTLRAELRRVPVDRERLTAALHQALRAAGR